MLVLYNPADGSVTPLMKDVNLVRRRLNDRNQVILFQVIKSQRIARGFLWEPEKGLTDLENFAPMAFNNHDQIVGYHIQLEQTMPPAPVLWTQGEVVPLAQFVNGSEENDSIWGNVISLTAINDNGYIIGQALFEDKKHAFILVPQ